jgi:hypothetical protein
MLPDLHMTICVAAVGFFVLDAATGHRDPDGLPLHFA